jgi:hypothetical protein
VSEYVPEPWAAVLLAAAAFRVWRLIAADKILDRPRDWLTRRPMYSDGLHRVTLDMWLHCPWCSGAWVTLGWWAAWMICPEWTVVAAVPFALNAVVALVAVNLDRGD